jgi:hypothetical protein
MKLNKLFKKKMMYIHAIKGGNFPTEILQRNLTKAGLVKDSRWVDDELLKEKVKDLLSLYNEMNNLNTLQ